MGSLVTGIGYIGARLVEILLDSGEQVAGLDNLFSTDAAAIHRLAERPGFTFVQGDVRDEGAVREAFAAGSPVETVYHLAAQSSGNPAAAPARYTEETNLTGSRIVLEQACEAGARTVVFGSSLQVYGRRVEGTVDETHPYGPILDLSHLSKVYVEKLLEMFASNRGIRCVSARIGLVYGLGPVMKADPMYMTAPNKFCLQAARGEAITVDSSGYWPTGMIHVEDAARGLRGLREQDRQDETDGQGRLIGGDGGTGRQGDGERAYRVVNLVGEVASVAGVAGIVEGLAMARGMRVEVRKPAEAPSVSSVSFGDAAARLGFVPRRSLEEGLAEVMEYFVEAGLGATGTGYTG